jgi:polar amino acid transport system substrate-binding protein
MVKIGALLLAGILLGSCATPREINRELVSQLAPTGKVRVGLSFGIALLASRGQEGGEPRGVVVDVARELGARLGVAVQFVPYAGPRLLTDAVNTGEWDIAFLAIEPARAKTIHFTPPYVEIEAAYLVRTNSTLRTLGDVDRAGVRVAVASGSAYDLYLTRALTAAQLIRAKGTDGAVKDLRADRADAVASIRQVLSTYADSASDVRLMDGNFMIIPQAIGMPYGRDAAARYLAAFVDDIKRSGFLANAIERNGAKGLKVAP